MVVYTALYLSDISIVYKLRLRKITMIKHTNKINVKNTNQVTIVWTGNNAITPGSEVKKKKALWKRT